MYILIAKNRAIRLQVMKKIIVGLGIFILIIGGLLFTLPFISIAKPLNFSVNVPKSQILLSENFAVPPSTVTHLIHLNAGDNVSMIVDVKSVSAPYADDVLDFSVSEGSQTFLSYSKISHLPYHFMWTVPNSANYSFVYDNSFSTTSKNVIVQLSSEWSERENHTVILNKPIISFEFVYLGVALTFAGIGITLFWATKKEVLKKSQP
jgi:hypothetical protein